MGIMCDCHYWQYYQFQWTINTGNNRQIDIASGIVGRLSNVWQQSWLSLATKLRVYNSLVPSVLLYDCETWTILKTDERKLEAFHVPNWWRHYCSCFEVVTCQRRILRIRWFHRVTSAEVTSQTEQEDLTSHIRRRRAAVVGHVRRLPEEAPGRMAMRLAVDTRAGGRPDNNPHWKRRPGRPRHSWVRQVEIDTGHRYLRWCCMGHCRRPLQLEDATTPAGQARLMMTSLLFLLWSCLVLGEKYEKVRSDHWMTRLHFWSIPRNRAMPWCATRRRGLLCFCTTTCW